MSILKKIINYLTDWLYEVWDWVYFILIGFGLLGLSFFSAFVSTMVVQISYGWVFLLTFIYFFFLVLPLSTEFSRYAYTATIRGVLKEAAALALATFTSFHSGVFLLTHNISTKGWSIFWGFIIWLISYFIFYTILDGLRLCSNCNRPMFSINPMCSKECANCGGRGYCRDNIGPSKGGFRTRPEVRCGCTPICSKCLSNQA